MKFRKSDDIIDIFGTLTEARSVLVFMPDKLEDFGIARKFIFKLIEDFPKAKFQFVIRKRYESLIDSYNSYGIIFVADNDVNFFGLPKKDLKQKILAMNYDIVIDLNDGFHLFSTYLCQKSRAKLKICLDNQDREPFYNFYFRAQAQENLEDKYQKLVQYLKKSVSTYTVNT